ncbi:MAG TPA: hypothetical protein VKB50_32515 [Vicinamibacterales bacterium]|nr:hypothetical protein [Vicinamibacterales bacterium]
MYRITALTGALCLSAFAWVVSAANDGTELRLRILDETAPPGSIVQMKVRTTEVTPISGGRGDFTFDQNAFEAVEGIGLFAPNGEVAGAAVVDGGRVRLAYMTTEAFTGDYPFMTVALRIRPDAIPGTRTTFALDPSSIWNLNGAFVRARISPGTVTIGGSVAIGNVIPGEGRLPAGTVVSVRGVGFGALSRLRAGDGLNITTPKLVSSTEMQFTLRGPANMTAQMLRVDNPDLSRSIYYSYMRGVPAATSSHALLSATQTIFSGTTRTVATVGPIPALNGAQFAGIALHNPNVTAVNVTIDLFAADGTFLYTSNRSLAAVSRLALDVAELLDGVTPPAGGSVRVTASSPIGAFGLLCDDNAGTVTPVSVSEAF